MGEGFARALARHLHQPQLREAVDRDPRAVARQGLPEFGQHRVAVLLRVHVDEVDDDDAAEVAQPELPRDRLRGLEVGLEDGVVERAPRDEAAGVHVDRGERFGLVDDEVAAALEIHAPGQRLLDLLLHREEVEEVLFDLFAVEEEIEKALARRVDLKSGGYLIIDQTEALTTVDVNTGGFVSGRSFDDTIFKTNLEASQAIARQLRLRNLGGIIIVDFIDMDTQEHRDAVLAEFRKALSRDRTRVTVNGFSQLGLVEMTRKRTRESLAHVLCEPCPVCAGRGELKTAQTICYEILREILRTERQFGAKEYRILASQMVIDMFLDEESVALTMLEDFIAKPISMQVETAYTQEQYDVILV